MIFCFTLAFAYTAKERNFFDISLSRVNNSWVSRVPVLNCQLSPLLRHDSLFNFHRVPSPIFFLRSLFYLPCLLSTTYISLYSLLSHFSLLHPLPPLSLLPLPLPSYLSLSFFPTQPCPSTFSLLKPSSLPPSPCSPLPPTPYICSSLLRTSHGRGAILQPTNNMLRAPFFPPFFPPFASQLSPTLASPRKQVNEEGKLGDTSVH